VRARSRNLFARSILSTGETIKPAEFFRLASGNTPSKPTAFPESFLFPRTYIESNN
jgi:hypothetical protein